MKLNLTIINFFSSFEINHSEFGNSPHPRAHFREKLKLVCTLLFYFFCAYLSAIYLYHAVRGSNMSLPKGLLECPLPKANTRCPLTIVSKTLPWNSIPS